MPQTLAAREFIENDGLTHAALWSTIGSEMNRSNEKKSPACTRCGKCCLADMIAYVTSEDLERWKKQDRQDILHIIENEQAVWLGDHFISARTGRLIYGCPFLEVEGEIFTCSIYETRPKVCADYEPGSSQICPQWKP
ncbi:MAG TPA: YkgJ family cysteine cluster protein [Deltaproteobacteria bacterium]|nr:YkgJ family cysteine cluster protein [Deltaproteobacteria bacterium]